MCTALVVGNMIGSGVFLLPASLAPFGWNAVFGWCVTIAGGMCLAIVFARLARHFPSSGGPYAYTREAFGPAPAFFVAWSYWICLWVGNAAIATAAMSYLSVLFPVLAQVQGLHALVTIGLIWTLTLVTCRGAGLAGWVQVVTTVLKLVPLLVVIGVAAVVLMQQGGAAILPLTPGEIRLDSVTAAATLTLWALLGLESATVPAEKVIRPERTIPRATLAGTAFTGVIYLFVCSAIILMTPAATLAASNAPFSDFIALHLGADAGVYISIFAVISALGALNGWILIQGELPYAMARDRVFPAWFAKATPSGIPVRAHIVSSSLLTVVVMMNYTKSMSELFTFVILLSTTACLVMYLMTALAALFLQVRKRLPGSAAFTIVAIAALLYAAWTIWGAGAEAMLWGLALLAAGAPVYLFVRLSTKGDAVS